LNLPARGGIFYGWVVVTGAWLAMLVSSAAISSFAIFAPELEAQFGWSRGMSSWGYTINTVAIAVFGLVAGMLADRIGLRRMVVVGAIIGGVGMALLSQTTELWQFYLLFGFVAPAGIALCFIVPTVATVRRWFMRRAAVAIAVAMTGSGLGVVFLIPLLQHTINVIGWSYAYIVLGAIMAVGASIGGAMLRKDPESGGAYPDGLKPTVEEIASRADFSTRMEKWSIREVFRTSSWWLLMFAQLYQVAVMGIFGHLVFWGYKDLGLPKADVVWILSIFALISVVGRLFGGFFSDWYMARFKISRKPVLFVCTLGVAIGCFLAMNVASQTGLIAVSLIIGFGYGVGLGVFPAYLGDLFGVINVPTLFGIMFFFTSGVFGAIGPVLFGYIHDRYGSYELAFLITAILCLISTVSLFLIKPSMKDKAIT